MIRTEDDLGILRQVVYYLLGIRRSYYYVCQRFYFGRSIDVTYYHMIRMLRFESSQIFGLTTIG